MCLHGFFKDFNIKNKYQLQQSLQTAAATVDTASAAAATAAV